MSSNTHIKKGRAAGLFTSRCGIWIGGRAKTKMFFWIFAWNWNEHPCARYMSKYAHPTTAASRKVSLNGDFIVMKMGRKKTGICTSSPGFLAKPNTEERRVGKECRSRWSPYH